MADRATLSLSKLDEFAAFAATRGFVREPVKGDYEVLRLRKGDAPPLLYYRRHGDHASIPQTTTKNPAEGLVSAYLHALRAPYHCPHCWRACSSNGCTQAGCSPSKEP